MTEPDQTHDVAVDDRHDADQDRSRLAAGKGRGGSHRHAEDHGRYRDALRHRDLRVLTAALLVDQIGSWSYGVVISVYLFDRTHSTQWLAALGLCRWGPGLLLSSYGGVIADRYERVTVLFASAVASAALMAGMAVVVASDAPVGLVLAISTMSSAALVPYQPAAGALTPEVAGTENLVRANAIFSALQNLVVILGPAIGGLLLLTGKPVIGVVVNAASFVIAAALVTRLHVRSRGAHPEGDAARRWTAGLRALAARPGAVAVVLFCALDSAVYGAASVLYTPLSIRLGTGPNGYSYLLAGAAVGGVLGAGLTNRLSSASRIAPVIMGSIGLQVLPFLATIPLRSPALVGVLQIPSGLSVIIVEVLALTTLQRDVSGDVLSRVLGIFETAVQGGILLAGLGVGILLAHTSVTVAMVAVGAGIPAMALAGLPALLRADRNSAAEGMVIRGAALTAC